MNWENAKKEENMAIICVILLKAYTHGVSVNKVKHYQTVLTLQIWKDKWMGILDIYMLGNAVSSKQIFF